MEQHFIRNFCIIAHIDHGKSTLADRLLELTGTVSERDMADQFLDQMDIERERGITIKAQAVRMIYKSPAGQEYEFNLIDTPGHVDFTYEVSRSLAACEGALLVVDASQGVEAQTIANAYLALEQGLTIIPLINKIDLPNANPPKVAKEIERTLPMSQGEIPYISAKEGWGTKEVLQAVVERIPSPSGNPQAPLKALIFDSIYDPYKGVIAYVRVMDGSVSVGERILLMSMGREAEALEIGIFTPGLRSIKSLVAGEVGYIATGLKNVKDCRVGDTITLAHRPTAKPLPGYRPIKPMVFAGLYPMESKEYNLLRNALDKLKLNDASLIYEQESSEALGFGFRCGFLGTLHMEIVQERLEREYNVKLLATNPSVEFRVNMKDGSQITVDNPAHLPSPVEIQSIEEPWMTITILTPHRYIGPIMELVTNRQGEFVKLAYLEGAQEEAATGERRVILTYAIPLSEILIDFYDQLKSHTQGFASLDYNFLEYRPSPLVRLDILVNNLPVDALSLIVHQEKAYREGKAIVERLRAIIPRQLFDVTIQAAIGSRVIARDTVKALRKNVLAKCYGGDVTRKRKLLEKQAEGKKRMKRLGQVDIPPEAFVALLRLK